MMPNTMQILGWKAQGFRCPDHEVNCCNNGGPPFKVSLIQMPNGTGKTTTLLLLRAALSGNATNWTTENIKAIQKKDSANTHGQFALKLLLDDKLTTIIMEFDFELGKVTYKTTSAIGQDTGFIIPRAFTKFMNPDFIHYFVFDGELAQHLLQRGSTDAILVIERLFSLNILDYISTKVNDFWDESTRNATAKDERGLARRGNRVMKLGTKLGKLKKAEASLKEREIKTEEALEQKRVHYDQDVIALQGHSELIENTLTKVTDYKERVKNSTKDVLNTMSDPHALSVKFAKDIYTFKVSLDRVKLPESAAREFFEELADEPECVCGRPIDDKIRDTIRERASQYLGSEEFSLLNSMKSIIEEAVGGDQETPEKNLAEKIRELTSWVRSREDARNELSELQKEAEGKDPKIAEARDEINRLDNELTDIRRQSRKFEDNDDRGDDDTTDIHIMTGKTKEAIEELAEIANTLQLRKKRDILANILESASEIAKRSIIEAICIQANEKIRELMPYNNIRIETIKRCLVLKGQSGGSAGETLSIAYAFLATLFNTSDQQLPFVVDSPAGSIDLAIRPKIAELVPKLSNQYIAFTISSERVKFTDRVAKASEDSIQFITIFRKGVMDVEEAVKAEQQSYHETDDGIMVIGEDFFNTFQVEQEDE